MEFKSLEQLIQVFTTGRIDSLPPFFVVGGIKYDRYESTKYDMFQLAAGKKPMAIYNLNREPGNVDKYEKLHTKAEDPTSFQDRLVFVWTMIRLRLRPAIVKFVSRARMGQVIVREVANDENKLTLDKNKLIGDAVDVVLINFNGGQPIKGKVDTGASMSSLHAESVEIVGSSGLGSDLVKFTFEGKRYKMTLQDNQAVQTADNGVENRPLVRFNIKVNDIVLNDVLINLNDRSDMPYKLLVGQNILEKGKFLIDPTVNEEMEKVDWDMLQEEFADLEVIDDSEFDVEALQDAIAVLNHLMEVPFDPT